MSTQKVNYPEQINDLSGGWLPDSNTWSYYSRTQAYTNDPAAGANITLNMANTSEFVVGSDVQVSSSAGSENTWVVDVVANTSITVHKLTLNHTTTTPLVTLLDVISINADVTAYIIKGTPIKWTQTTVKYGTVYSSTYSGGVTKLVLIHNSDYTLTNAAISSPYYSNIVNPSGFPASFTFDPAPIGWSVLPSTSLTYRYSVVGTRMYVEITQGSDGGTSDQTYIVYALPTFATAITLTVATTTQDNGTVQTTPGRMVIGSAAVFSQGVLRRATGFKDMTTGAFTASGAKRQSISVWIFW